jgi:hypothetical protein
MKPAAAAGACTQCCTTVSNSLSIMTDRAMVLPAVADDQTLVDQALRAPLFEHLRLRLMTLTWCIRAPAHAACIVTIQTTDLYDVSKDLPQVVLMISTHA